MFNEENKDKREEDYYNKIKKLTYPEFQTIDKELIECFCNLREFESGENDPCMMVSLPKSIKKLIIPHKYLRAINLNELSNLSHLTISTDERDEQWRSKIEKEY